MPEEKQLPDETTITKTITIKQIIQMQLIWYIINFLIVFSQKNIGFELPYFTNLYQISFKIIGRSFFISFLLYTITTRELKFSDLGLTRNNFLFYFSIGIKLSSFLVIGLIIANISLNNYNPLIKITTPGQLATSLFYFGLVSAGLLIPALSKELFYRGLLYHYFQKKWGSDRTFFLTIFYYTFSYLDLRPGSLAVHFFVGGITTYLYHKTESIIAPTVFQTAYQAGLTVYLFSFTHWPF